MFELESCVDMAEGVLGCCTSDVELAMERCGVKNVVCFWSSSADGWKVSDVDLEEERAPWV